MKKEKKTQEKKSFNFSNIGEGYPHSGGLKTSSKPSYIEGLKWKSGSVFTLEKTSCPDNTKKLSCVYSIDIAGLNKRALCWEVPKNLPTMYLELTGTKKLNDGQILPLFKVTDKKPQ